MFCHLSGHGVRVTSTGHFQYCSLLLCIHAVFNWCSNRQRAATVSVQLANDHCLGEIYTCKLSTIFSQSVECYMLRQCYSLKVKVVIDMMGARFPSHVGYARTNCILSYSYVYQGIHVQFFLFHF